MNISEFAILKNNGFSETFTSIEGALKYYYSDPEVCCSLFRKALCRTCAADDVPKSPATELAPDAASLPLLPHPHCSP